MEINEIEFLDFQNCLRLSNKEIEIIISTAFGPRILAYNFIGSGNVFGIHSEAQVETSLGIWKPFGGHRLWIAPENMPNSYAPDNAPIEYVFDEQINSFALIQPVETISQTQKKIIISLDTEGSGVRVRHQITNLGGAEIECAAWALTIMRGGGEVLIPNEPFAPYSAETLLPVRNLTLWSYTDLSDPRWSFDAESIRLKVDKEQTSPQKIGVLNKQGWIRYQLEDIIFTKRFRYFDNFLYPDLNSNTEVYCAGDFIEIETLSPIRTLKPGATLEHEEHWQLENPF